MTLGPSSLTADQITERPFGERNSSYVYVRTGGTVRVQRPASSARVGALLWAILRLVFGAFATREECAAGIAARQAALRTEESSR
jgi:hypothetical protein